jgi:hypothetical protein
MSELAAENLNQPATEGLTVLANSPMLDIEPEGRIEGFAENLTPHHRKDTIVQNFLFCLVTASSPPSGDWRPGVH